MGRLPCEHRFTSNRRQTCGSSKSVRLADFRLNVVDVAFEDHDLHNSSFFELPKPRAGLKADAQRVVFVMGRQHAGLEDVADIDEH